MFVPAAANLQNTRYSGASSIDSDKFRFCNEHILFGQYHTIKCKVLPLQKLNFTDNQ